MCDDYVCASCGSAFHKSDLMVECGTCGRVFCSFECSEIDYSFSPALGECKYCLGTDATKDQLLEAACSALNMSVVEFKTFFLNNQ